MQTVLREYSSRLSYITARDVYKRQRPRLLREMTQFETIMFLKSPTPSVPIFIAAEVEISVQPEMCIRDR